jgi:hypothetical protein
MRIASNLQKYMTERTRREPVPLTPGVGAARVVHREAMPPANGRLDDPDAGEGVDGPRAALRLGLRRVPERAALVPPPREELRDTGNASQNKSLFKEGRERGTRGADARDRPGRWRGSCGCRRRRR